MIKLAKGAVNESKAIQSAVHIRNQIPQQINQLNRQLKQTEERQHRLLEAIETGIVDLDETVQRRAQQLKSAREALLIELAGVRREQSIPADQLKASLVNTFATRLYTRLLHHFTHTLFTSFDAASLQLLFLICHAPFWSRAFSARRRASSICSGVTIRSPAPES